MQRFSLNAALSAALSVVRVLQLLLAIALSSYGLSAAAEVTQSSASGFTSKHQLQLAAAPAEVWRALTRELPRWWDASHSYSGKAKNFRLQAKAGGCFCERLPEGGSVEHMHVVFAQPNRELRMTGGLGPLQTLAVSGVMVFRITVTPQGSQLDYSYRVSGDTATNLAILAGPVDAVQLGQLRRLQQWLTTGRVADAAEPG